MKEKFKKAAGSFLCRSVLCAAMFFLLSLLWRYAPQKWEYVKKLLGADSDLNSVAASVVRLVKELLPI